jgi:hypothetical protein
VSGEDEHLSRLQTERTEENIKSMVGFPWGYPSLYSMERFEAA